MEAPLGVSYDSLYGRCGAYVESLPDERAKNSSVRLRDYLVGAMALFVVKHPSLLALDQSFGRDVYTGDCNILRKKVSLEQNKSRNR